MKFWDYENLDCDKIGDMSQLAGVRQYEFTSGKAKGVEALEINTGSGFSFTVLPGRGMDIAWTNYRGLPLSYMSKTGVVSPSYYESTGMNWLHNFFAGALTTCGLLHVGGPEKVMHPVIGEREYGLHGRICNCAAEQVSVFEDFVDGEYVIKVSGLMKEGILHGESLTLRREITTKFGSSEFKIRDTVTNRDANPVNTKILYHINFGYPFLDAGSRLVADSKEILAADSEAKKHIDKAFEFEEPIPGMREKGYAHDFNTDKDGNVKVALVSDKLDVGVAVEYNKNQLPYFNEWKMMNKKEYVVGLEPCTFLPTGVIDADKMGDVILPGETRVYEVTYKILDGSENIRKYEDEVFGK